MEDLNIRNFKLINGDSIIALVSSDNNDNYMVERPVSVHSNIVGGYQLRPWFPFSDQKRYSIDKHNIVCDSSIIDQMKVEYITYTLSAREAFEPPESHDAVVDRITNTVMKEFGTDDEDDEENDLPDGNLLH